MLLFKKTAFVSLILTTFWLIFTGCNTPTAETKAEAIDLEGYEISDIGNGVSLAKKYKNEQVLLEEGYITHGQKNGIWINYHEKNGRILKTQAFSNGKLNGLVCEYDQKGQITKLANYTNDVLNGIKEEYRHGRTTKSTPYLNGVIEGTYKEYFSNGKIQKEIQYLNGKMDGKYRYYKDDGEITMEYIYKEGNKISGGIIE